MVAENEITKPRNFRYTGDYCEMLIRILHSNLKHQYHHGMLIQREPNVFTGRLVHILSISLTLPKKSLVKPGYVDRIPKFSAFKLPLRDPSHLNLGCVLIGVALTLINRLLFVSYNKQKVGLIVLSFNIFMQPLTNSFPRIQRRIKKQNNLNGIVIFKRLCATDYSTQLKSPSTVVSFEKYAALA